MRRGYRRVRGDFSPYLADLDLAAPPIGIAPRAADGIAQLFRASRFDANWDAIKQLPDDMLVVTLSMVCPFEPAEKQALLEAPTDAERPRPCWRCCRWARWRRTRRTAAT